MRALPLGFGFDSETLIVTDKGYKLFYHEHDDYFGTREETYMKDWEEEDYHRAGLKDVKALYRWIERNG